MKFAICQELFEGWDWDRQCRFIAETGYTGVEVAPFALSGPPSRLTPADRAQYRTIAERHGLEIIGLHWLLAKTQGFHVTSPDAAIRRATSAYLRALGDLCADLGGAIMVFGSPLQRNLAEGMSRAQGLELAAEVFRDALPRIAERGVTICMEPLTPKETNFINTCADAAELIERVGHPHFMLHQDVKAMLSEEEPIPALVHRFRQLTRHFHVNDSNLLGPGMGETDFHPILRALQETQYAGWVSVEVFDYAPGAERIARESIECLEQTLRDLAR
ncbi:MAG: sugar phosphate isomerase/epimerase family protein [Planctomycetaceae bacterium]